MQGYNGKLVELPKKGFALIVTDLHGNLEDFNKFMGIWEKFDDKNNHFILAGDFIHSMDGKDGSIEILESLKSRWENSQNFHLLLGNHEWATLAGISVYKCGFNQTIGFESLLKEKFRDGWMIKLEEYVEFFKKLPIAVITRNKVFISHAGPPRGIRSIDEIVHIADEGYIENNRLSEILWNRYGSSYTEQDIEHFLKAVKCKAMIVGHTPVDGIELIGENQLIVSSSYSSGKKAYVELDLQKEIKNGEDIFKMVRYI